MYARWVRRCSAGRYREGPHIRSPAKPSVLVTAVVRVLIVNLIFEDRDRALLARDEVQIWCYDVGPPPSVVANVAVLCCPLGQVMSNQGLTHLPVR